MRPIQNLIKNIHKNGKGKKYDCIVGISGGTDSTYCLYLAHTWGLRPLAVHFDSGWNSEISVSNIKNVTSKLDIDLYTFVADWEEFKDLQIAFLKASVPEADMPTDIAYLSVLYNMALKEKIKYIITGSNFRTEGNQPPAWGYGDGKYINSIYKKFGKKKKLEKIPNHLLSDLFYYHLIKGIKLIKPLYYINYRKIDAMKFLENELGWKYYGGHHYENVYTRFVHGYYLKKKFNIDKRIIEYSAMIRSHQLDRDEALMKLHYPTYPEEEVKQDIKFVMNKLNLTEQEFDQIMNADCKIFSDYDTYYPLIMKIKILIDIAHRLKLYPDKIYGKYNY